MSFKAGPGSKRIATSARQINPTVAFAQPVRIDAAWARIGTADRGAIHRIVDTLVYPYGTQNKVFDVIEADLLCLHRDRLLFPRTIGELTRRDIDITDAFDRVVIQHDLNGQRVAEIEPIGKLLRSRVAADLQRRQTLDLFIKRSFSLCQQQARMRSGACHRSIALHTFRQSGSRWRGRSGAGSTHRAVANAPRTRRLARTTARTRWHPLRQAAAQTTPTARAIVSSDNRTCALKNFLR